MDLTMYFVTDHNYCGECSDWFVNARTPEEAFAMWRMKVWIVEGESVPGDNREVTVFIVPDVRGTAPEIMDWPHGTATKFPLHFDSLTTLAVLAEFEAELKKEEENANADP